MAQYVELQEEAPASTSNDGAQPPKKAVRRSSLAAGGLSTFPVQQKQQQPKKERRASLAVGASSEKLLAAFMPKRRAGSFSDILTMDDSDNSHDSINPSNNNTTRTAASALSADNLKSFLSPELLEQMQQRESWKKKTISSSSAIHSDTPHKNQQEKESALSKLVSPNVMQALQTRQKSFQAARGGNDDEAKSSHCVSDDTDDASDNEKPIGISSRELNESSKSLSSQEYSENSDENYENDDDLMQCRLQLKREEDDQRAPKRNDPPKEKEMRRKQKKNDADFKMKRSNYVRSRSRSSSLDPNLEPRCSGKLQQQQQQQQQQRKASSNTKRQARDKNMAMSSDHFPNSTDHIHRRRAMARRSKSSDMSNVVETRRSGANIRLRRTKSSKGPAPIPLARSNTAPAPIATMSQSRPGLQPSGKSRRSSRVQRNLGSNIFQAQLMQAFVHEEELELSESEHDADNNADDASVTSISSNSSLEDSHKSNSKKKKKGTFKKAKRAFKTKQQHHKSPCLDESFVEDDDNVNSDTNMPAHVNILIELVRARNILIGDTTTSDPYVLAKLGGRQIHKTSKIMKT